MNEILTFIANSDSSALIVISIISATTVGVLLSNQDYSNRRTNIILKCSDNVTMESQESLAKVVAITHSNNKLLEIRKEVVKTMLDFTEFLHQEKDKRDTNLDKLAPLGLKTYIQNLFK